MKKVAMGITAVMVLFFLIGCGTTSNIRPTSFTEMPNLASYETVVVLDFEDGVDISKIKPEKLTEYKELMKIAVKNFADRIAGEIRKTGAFENVLREGTKDKAVQVSGVITRYTEGNAALRLFIGLGAGSSYFDANVDIFDHESMHKIGAINVDKNSWALGGGLAAGQSVESFMKGAAKKIASELKKAKQGMAVAVK